MDYYAEQSLFIKIVIFMIAWFIIAILGKISVPQIPVPKWLKILSYGWFKGNSFGLPWLFCKSEIICCSSSMPSATYFIILPVCQPHFPTRFGLYLHLYSRRAR